MGACSAAARGTYPEREQIRPLETTRRQFLEVVATGAVVIGAAGVGSGCLGPPGVEPQRFGVVGAGNVADIPVGTLRVVGGRSVCIGRDQDGLYAMTLTCTHQGCDMARRGSVDPRGVRCNCHGAAFDANGEVKGGPAPDPLSHFEVTIDGNGDVSVNTDVDVDASHRVPV